MMAEILSTSAEARKMALGLKHVAYGGELLAHLMSTSSKMENLHEKIQSMVSSNVEDDEKYKKMNEIALAQLKWWEKAKARRL